MNRTLAHWLMLAIVSQMSGAAIAHHSFAATFDDKNHIEVEGIVTEFLFKNPHLLIYLESTNPDGSVTQWMSEGEAATRYRHAGWDENTLPVGQRVRISGSGTHDGSPMIWVDKVALLDPQTREVLATIDHRADIKLALGLVASADNSDAKVLQVIPQTLPTGEPNFTGAWVENRETSAKPPWGRDPALPFNAAGSTVQAGWNEANDPQIFCEPAGVVRKAAFTPHPLAIEQYPDRVVFNYEEYSGTRTVFLGQHVAELGVPSPMGDSVGRYESNQLIIETVNLSSTPTSLLGNYLSEEAKVTEIYFRADDPKYGSQITTVTTVTDPTYLTEPWTISRTKLFEAGYKLTENECHEPLRERGTTN